MVSVVHRTDPWPTRRVRERENDASSLEGDDVHCFHSLFVLSLSPFHLVADLFTFRRYPLQHRFPVRRPCTFRNSTRTDPPSSPFAVPSLPSVTGRVSVRLSPFSFLQSQRLTLLSSSPRSRSQREPPGSRRRFVPRLGRRRLPRLVLRRAHRVCRLCVRSDGAHWRCLADWAKGALPSRSSSSFPPFLTSTSHRSSPP